MPTAPCRGKILQRLRFAIRRGTVLLEHEIITAYDYYYEACRLY